MKAAVEYVAPDIIEVSKFALCACLAKVIKYGKEAARPLVAPAWFMVMSVIVEPFFVTVS